MICILKRVLWVLLVCIVLLRVAGCEPAPEKKPLAEPVDLNTTVGQLGQLYQYSAVPVKGYGIVAGLAGTGSSECPPELRTALSKYIRANTGGDIVVNPNKFINSLDTAVVEIYGKIPAVATKGERFDVKVVAFSRSQTTSLAGGTLYTAQLKEMSRLLRFDMYVATLAKAQGPIFMDKSGDGDTTDGYILGGGVVTEGVRLALGLYKPSYHAASAIRNRLNERFEPHTAKAISPNEIEFKVPDKYRPQKAKFLSMVRLLYLAEDKELRNRRIEMLTRKLLEDENKLEAEYSLEAIGRASLDSMHPLLKSEDEVVRFHSARCMLSIGDNRAIGALQDIARDTNSTLRIEAIEAIGLNAKRDVATPILGRLLTDDDFEVKYAAYEQLRRLDDIAVSRTVVGGKFFVDQISRKGPKIIYVSRQDVPRIVIFGTPIECEKGIFVESPDKSIVINARPGDKRVSVMRKLPNRPRLVGPLASTYELTDIFRTLCGDPQIEDNPLLRPGLGASYSDVVSVLSKMCRIGAVRAEFITGDLTDAGSFLQKIGFNDR